VVSVSLKNGAEFAGNRVWGSVEFFSHPHSFTSGGGAGFGDEGGEGSGGGLVGDGDVCGRWWVRLDRTAGSGGRVVGDVEDYRRRKKVRMIKFRYRGVYNKTVHHKLIQELLVVHCGFHMYLVLCMIVERLILEENDKEESEEMKGKKGTGSFFFFFKNEIKQNKILAFILCLILYVNCTYFYFTFCHQSY